MGVSYERGTPVGSHLRSPLYGGGTHDSGHAPSIRGSWALAGPPSGPDLRGFATRQPKQMFYLVTPQL